MKKVVIISLCMSVYVLQSAEQVKTTLFQRFKTNVNSLGTKIQTGAKNLRDRARNNLRLSGDNDDRQSFMSVLKNNIKDSASQTPGVIAKGIKKAPGAIVDGGKSAGKYIVTKVGELKGYVGGKISRKNNIKAPAQEQEPDNRLQENDNDVELTQQDQNDRVSIDNVNANRRSAISTLRRNSSSSMLVRKPSVSVRRQSSIVPAKEQGEPEGQVQKVDNDDDLDDNNIVKTEKYDDTDAYDRIEKKTYKDGTIITTYSNKDYLKRKKEIVKNDGTKITEYDSDNIRGKVQEIVEDGTTTTTYDSNKSGGKVQEIVEKDGTTTTTYDPNKDMGLA